MELKSLTLFLSLLSLSSMAQERDKTVKRDSVEIKAQVTELEKTKRELVEKTGKLRMAIRSDSILLAKTRIQRNEQNDQFLNIEKDISALEKTSNKTKEQKQLLKSLKSGLSDREEQLKAQDKGMSVVEEKNNQSRRDLEAAEEIIKQLDQQIIELRKLLAT